MSLRDGRLRAAKEYFANMKWLLRGLRYEQELAVGARGHRRKLLEERIVTVKMRLGLSLDAALPHDLEKPEAVLKGDLDKRGKSVSKRLEKLTRARPTTKRAQERMRLQVYRAAAARALKRARGK